MLRQCISQCYPEKQNQQGCLGVYVWVCECVCVCAPVHIYFYIYLSIYLSIQGEVGTDLV